MTMRRMARALAILALLLAPACARSAGSSEEVTQALADIEALNADVARLESSITDLEGEDDDLARRLDGLSERLTTALDNLRESLAEVRAGVEGAERSAAAALARAESVASDLDILETRYDYHLRRYHQ